MSFLIEYETLCVLKLRNFIAKVERILFMKNFMSYSIFQNTKTIFLYVLLLVDKHTNYLLLMGHKQIIIKNNPMMNGYSILKFYFFQPSVGII